MFIQFLTWIGRWIGESALWANHEAHIHIIETRRFDFLLLGANAGKRIDKTIPAGGYVCHND